MSISVIIPAYNYARLLHYYALCTLQYMQSFATVPHKGLKNAQDTLMRIVPCGDTPSGIAAKVQELQGYVFIVPEPLKKITGFPPSRE